MNDVVCKSDLGTNSKPDGPPLAAFLPVFSLFLWFGFLLSETPLIISPAEHQTASVLFGEQFIDGINVRARVPAKSLLRVLPLLTFLVVNLRH